MRSFVIAALVAALCLALCASPVTAGAGLYGPRDLVVELTAANFQSEVIKSKDVWIVEFYAPWCGHCKSLAPEWAKAANALAGVVKVGAVNMDDHAAVGQPYGIKGFPTIKIFGGDKASPADYNGQRTAKDIVDAALREASKVVRDRLSGGKSSGSSSSKSSKSSGSSGSGSGSGKVVEGTESNFKAEVLESDELVMVEFFAPWCGHCKNLEPEWKKAAAQLGGVAKLVAVDATVHQSLASRYEVKGYPTIMVFKPGKTDKPEPYNGGRTASDIATFARNAAEQFAKPRPVVQVTTRAELEEHCKEKASLCLLTVVPSIYDGGAKARNAILSTLQSLSKKYARKPFSFVWLEAGTQSGLEDALLQGNTFYPAPVALNLKKGRFSPMVGSFTVESVGEFLNRLLAGKEPTIPLPGGADAKLPFNDSKDKWDGKDGKPLEDKDL